MTAAAGGRPGSSRAGDLPPAHEVVEQVLGAAGDEGCVVLVEDAYEAEVRFANNRTTTNGVRRDRRVTVVRMVGMGGGTAAGVARQAGAVDAVALAAAAEADARASGPADDAAPLVEGSAEAGFADESPRTDLGVLGGVLSSLGGAFRRAEDASRRLSGYAEHRMATTYLGSSTGLRRRHVQPSGALHLVARSEDGTRSSWAGAGTDDFSDVDVEALEAQVGEGLARAGRRIEVPAGRHEVILPPDAVADLMIALAESAGGREAEEGRTAFSRPGGGTRVGEELTPLPFHLWTDPHQPGLESAPFLAAGASGPNVSVFDNGLPLAATDWLRDGRLAHLAYHRAGAARSGVAAVPPPSNLTLDLPGAAGSVDDLVARTERGLLLTCLWYIREVDPATLLLTGLTRDGVYVVEDGEVVGATTNFRFNESPVGVLARTIEAGGVRRSLGREFGEWMNRTAMPALRVGDFNMSSVSQAS